MSQLRAGIGFSLSGHNLELALVSHYQVTA